MNIYFGNLPFSVSEDQLRKLVEPFGEVKSVKLITDRETGQPRGFAFVEMPNQEEAQEAISRLNGSHFEGKTLTVNEARPREQRSFGGGGSRGRFGGSGSGSGDRPYRGGGNNSWRMNRS